MNPLNAPLPQWPTRPVALAQMKPAPYNPRTIGEDELSALRHSLETYGLVQPIVWNERTGHVVGGLARVIILSQRGDAEAQACVVNLAEEDEQELNLALNNHAAQGQFKLKALAEVIKTIKARKTADEFAASGLDRLAAFLLNEGIEQVSYAGERRKFISRKEAAEQGVPRSEIKQFSIYYSGDQCRIFLQRVGDLHEKYGTDNLTDLIFLLVGKAHRELAPEAAPLDATSTPADGDVADADAATVIRKPVSEFGAAGNQA